MAASPPRDLEEPTMEMKLALILEEGLLGWQAVNVAGHLALAIGRRANPEIMGEHPLVDGSGIEHMGICKYPVIALRTSQRDLRRIAHAAKSGSGFLVADYPREMLDTYTDAELVSAIRAKAEPSLEYLGVAVLGATGDVKRLTSGIALWK
jgi:hypothetical protein